MKEAVKTVSPLTPILFPYDPGQFWQSIRQIIREEATNAEKQKPVSSEYETPGMAFKPLYKIAEVWKLFHVQGLPFMNGPATGS